MRFAKIQSKANRKPEFCDSESLAYTAGVNPRPTVQMRTEPKPDRIFGIAIATKRALVCVLRKFKARQTESPNFAIARALHTPYNQPDEVGLHRGATSSTRGGFHPQSGFHYELTSPAYAFALWQ
ncbi:MAG: hypothetical protein IJF38_00400 [Clostridia bacterium]|nr:hypothetical protein [Clostridia bacterium]